MLPDKSILFLERKDVVKGFSDFQKKGECCPLLAKDSPCFLLAAQFTLPPLIGNLALCFV